MTTSITVSIQNVEPLGEFYVSRSDGFVPPSDEMWIEKLRDLLTAKVGPELINKFLEAGTCNIGLVSGPRGPMMIPNLQLLIAVEVPLKYMKRNFNAPIAGRQPIYTVEPVEKELVVSWDCRQLLESTDSKHLFFRRNVLQMLFILLQCEAHDQT